MSTTTPTAAARQTGSTSGQGTTTIDDTVVAKVAGIAAREVTGVHGLGGGAARAIGALRSVVNSTDLTQGVSVEVGETQVAADITVVAEYPAPLQDVADGVRSSVAHAIEGIVGMEVAEINVTINDVYIAEDDDNNAEPRVQ
ncbi:MAG: alkaline-shock protein [Frondihabitans sp.]|nr:alkaline-shock protein [Frondihabitans sp.]